jgi:hypothetical protein
VLDLRLTAGREWAAGWASWLKAKRKKFFFIQGFLNPFSKEFEFLF